MKLLLRNSHATPVATLSVYTCRAEPVDLGLSLFTRWLINYIFKVKLTAASVELAQYGGQALVEAYTNGGFGKFQSFRFKDPMKCHKELLMQTLYNSLGSILEST